MASTDLHIRARASNGPFKARGFSPQPKKGMIMQFSGPTSNLRTLAGKLFFNNSSQRANFETQDTFTPSALQQSIT